MTKDEKIRQNVLDDLRWSPRVNSTHIGVAVRSGVVELSGRVETFAEKLEAEHIALAVRGVKGVAEEILVRLPNEKRTSDEELAERAGRSRLGIAAAWRRRQGEGRKRLGHLDGRSQIGARARGRIVGRQAAFRRRGSDERDHYSRACRADRCEGADRGGFERQALLQADFLSVSFQEELSF